MRDPLRVLAITKIFPNVCEPTSAPFNRQQFAALAEHCELRVLATIPWFPGARFAKGSSAGRLTAVPRRDHVAGLDVEHPRTAFIPRAGQGLWGPLYAASLAPTLWRYRGWPDVVLGSWAYPDGFAAVVAGQVLRVPTVVKLHGSDINSLAQLPGPRRGLAWALPRAARVVAVSQPLAEAAIALGAVPARVRIVRNGVDASLFHPRDRATARKTLGLSEAPTIVYVGNLKVAKGVVDLASAFVQVAARRPDARLVMVGQGDARAEVERVLAPVAAATLLPGPAPLEEVPTWMAAADVVVLASWAEGTPNVVLEALACGRRVVATAVGGIPDLLTSTTLGTLVPAHAPADLAAALVTALDTPYDADVVASTGARGGWQDSALALRAVLAEAIADPVRATVTR